jgi:glutaredoxin
MQPTIHVQLYSRDGCSLCDKAHALLLIAGRETPIEVEVIDIDEDPALRVQYDQRIPVLRVGEAVICEGVVTLTRLREAIALVTAP